MGPHPVAADVAADAAIQDARGWLIVVTSRTA
jgi:hypothetical protein